MSKILHTNIRYFINYDHIGSCSLYLPPQKKNRAYIQKLKTFIPGESFGEISLITDDEIKTGTIMCDEDSYFLTIEKQYFGYLRSDFEK